MKKKKLKSCGRTVVSRYELCARCRRLLLKERKKVIGYALLVAVFGLLFAYGVWRYGLAQALIEFFGAVVLAGVVTLAVFLIKK